MYITCLLTYNSVLHSCNTGNANYNLVCPKLKCNLVGGKTFNVTICQLWNSLLITLWQKTSVQSFKNALRQFFLRSQQNLNHFIV